MYNNVGLEMPRILWQGRLIKFSTLPECFFTTSKPHLNLEGSLNILYINIITHRPQPGVEEGKGSLTATNITNTSATTVSRILRVFGIQGDKRGFFLAVSILYGWLSSLPLWAGAAVLRVGRRALATCTRGLKGELLRP